MVVLWVFLLVGLKIPIVAACWILWRAINDVPEQVVGEVDDDGGAKAFKPGPRRRGPHGDAGETGRARRRREAAHAGDRTPVTRTIARRSD